MQKRRFVLKELKLAVRRPSGEPEGVGDRKRAALVDTAAGLRPQADELAQAAVSTRAALQRGRREFKTILRAPPFYTSFLQWPN